MVIVITGGTGLLGKATAQTLESGGHEVRILSRNASARFRWDPVHAYIDKSVFEQADAVVHLAGETISGRWTAEKKRQIIESRSRSTDLLAEAISSTGLKPVVICASAIGYYGDRGKHVCMETDGPGSGFLCDTTRIWEERLADIPASRKVILRIGVVLSMLGGALPQMVLPVKMFAGSPFGSGRQYISWIHIEDMVKMICCSIDRSMEGALREDLSGTYNAVAPHPVINDDFMREIAATLSKPYFLPAVPSFLLKGMLGEMSVLLTDSIRVSANRIQDAGFSFKFPDLKAALGSLLKK